MKAGLVFDEHIDLSSYAIHDYGNNGVNKRLLSKTHPSKTTLYDINSVVVYNAFARLEDTTWLISAPET